MSNIDSPKQPKTPGLLRKMSPATAEAVSNSPLLKLPAKLHNRIYEYVMEGKPRIASLRPHTMNNLGIKDEHAVWFTAEYGACEPDLLAASRKIRREAKGMFYARRACKAVLFASGRDEPEMIYWESAAET